MEIWDQLKTAICLEAFLFANQMRKKCMKLNCLMKVCQVKSSSTRDFDQVLLDKPVILTDILSSSFSLDDNFIGVSDAATPYCRKQFCSSRHICLPSRTIRVMMFKLLLFIAFVLFLLTFSSCHISLPGGTWCLARNSASVCICIVMVGLHLHLHICIFAMLCA